MEDFEVKSIIEISRVGLARIIKFGVKGHFKVARDLTGFAKFL